MTDNTALAQKLEALLAAYRKPNSETSAAFALRSHLVAHIDTILTALRTPAPAPVGGDVVEALKDVLASLVAAHSLLARSPKTAASSDKMFDQMLKDYEKSIDRGRKAYAALQSPTAPEQDAVEQRDRDAAADCIPFATDSFRQAIRNGEHDDNDTVQALRRHRIAAMPPKVEAPAEAAERERCAMIIGAIQPDEDAAGCPATWDDFVQIAQCAIRAGGEA